MHPIDAKIFTSKSRTVKVIASTWLVAVVLALPYLYCKSYAFSIDSHLGSVSRFICADRFDEIDVMMYGRRQQSIDDYDDGLHQSLSDMHCMSLVIALFLIFRGLSKALNYSETHLSAISINVQHETWLPISNRQLSRKISTPGQLRARSVLALILSENHQN